MSIFVLNIAWGEDGEALLGVYDSFEAARQAAEVYDPSGAECLVIYERQVNASAVLDSKFVECI